MILPFVLICIGKLASEGLGFVRWPGYKATGLSKLIFILRCSASANS